LGFAFFLHSWEAHWVLKAGLWCGYWVLQGIVLTGLWVIAHECGHGGFSAHKQLNDLVGLALHSALLVPYHSWRITHSNHHKGTGHLEKDQVFVPTGRTKYWTSKVFGLIPRNSEFAEVIFPLIAALEIVIMLTLGWFGYLLFNISGQTYKRKDEKDGKEKTLWANHFHPSSPLFEERNKFDIILSDIGIITVLAILTFLSWKFSFLTVVKFYGIPYLFVNFWLVLITYLQHTDACLPHYRGEEWNFLRGALCTVDRDYGVFLNYMFHNIGNTHICHHLFSYMPHYHAEEATEHIKKVIGSFYLQDSTPIAQALWKSFTKCRFVEENANVVFYKQKQ